MLSYSKTTYVANVTNEPVLSTLPNTDVKKVAFSIAVNRKNAQKLKEEGKQDVDYWNCELIGNRAEALHSKLKKGDPIFLVGEMHNDRSTETTSSGVKTNYYPKLIVDEYRIIS